MSQRVCLCCFVVASLHDNISHWRSGDKPDDDAEQTAADTAIGQAVVGKTHSL